MQAYVQLQCPSPAGRMPHTKASSQSVFRQLPTTRSPIAFCTSISRLQLPQRTRPADHAETCYTTNDPTDLGTLPASIQRSKADSRCSPTHPLLHAAGWQTTFACQSPMHSQLRWLSFLLPQASITGTFLPHMRLHQVRASAGNVSSQASNPCCAYCSPPNSPRVG